MTTNPRPDQFLAHGLRRHALNRAKGAAIIALAAALIIAAMLSIHFASQAGHAVATGAGWALADLLSGTSITVLVTHLWLPLIADIRATLRTIRKPR